MSVVSSELDTLTDIEHSILCIDPIDTPQFKYSLFHYVFASNYIKEEFMKYFQRKSELQKQDFINLIDGSAKCAVLRGHLSLRG